MSRLPPVWWEVRGGDVRYGLETAQFTEYRLNTVKSTRIVQSGGEKGHQF